ncbi:transposable element Tcb1 transposase [Trichonephila clavipes]|nr:transposable element Tcb1 transposase [Trichonephila clavipes]
MSTGNSGKTILFCNDRRPRTGLGLPPYTIITHSVKKQQSVKPIFKHLSATPRWSDSNLEVDAEQLRYAPPHWSCIGYYGMGRYWISLSRSTSTHCRYFKQPVLHLRGVEPVVLPYLQGLATAIFQKDNARPHVARIVQRFFVNHQIELLPLPARSPDLLQIENMWSMVAQRLTQLTPPAATPDQLWQSVEAAWSAAPQDHI